MIVSCGKNADEKRDSAMLSARILLTNRKFQEAINVLEDAGEATSNANYMVLLATAYAGRGGFDALRLFQTDIPNFASPSPMGGIATFTSSDDMTSPTDSDYDDVLRAINILLYAGGLSTSEHPTSTTRRAVFEKEDADNIEMLLIYMILTNLGRYFRYFANASSGGVKGGGTGAGNCFLNYSNVDFTPAADNIPSLEFDTMTSYFGNNGGTTGACSALNDGSADLGAQGAINISRACQGVVLINNFLHIFPNVLGSIADADFNDIKDIETVLNSAKTLVANHKAGSETVVNDALSQTLCESEVAADTEFLETFFAFVMEPLIQ